MKGVIAHCISPKWSKVNMRNFLVHPYFHAKYERTVFEIQLVLEEDTHIRSFIHNN